MTLASRDTDGVRLITVTETRIDAALGIRFKDAMRQAMADGHDRIVLDLSGVVFIDSSGLGAVVAAMKALETGRRLDLCGLGGTVEKVFRLTRLDTVFRIYPTAEAALSATDS